VAYDEKLASRIEAIVHGWPGVEPKKMFGSVGWMMNGNICVGIWKEDLIVRCSPDEWPRLLREKHVAEFDITGRSMKGWLLVKPPAMSDATRLSRWVNLAREFVRMLPAKSPKPARGRAAAKPATKRTR
jgi:hypothetical protein